MNLTKLFEMQKSLDAKIINEKGLEDMDRLPNLILALQVELGECANEWRGFKYWSKDQLPRDFCQSCQLSSMPHKCKNPLLEEYVDCLHFILSIALIEEDYHIYYSENYTFDNVIQAFQYVFSEVSKLKDNLEGWRYVLDGFFALGKLLGFTQEQIYQAYINKNAINHERQVNGY